MEIDKMLEFTKSGATRVIRFTPDEKGVMQKICYDPQTGEVYDEYKRDIIVEK